MIIWWSGSPPWSHDSDQRHDHQNKTHVFSSCDNDTGWETLVMWPVSIRVIFILYMLIIEQLNDRNRQTETRDISHQHKHWWALNQTSHEHSRHGKNRFAVWQIQDFDVQFLTFNWSYQLKSSHLHLAPSTRGVMITDQHKRPWCSWKNSPHAHVCSVRSYLWCTHTHWEKRNLMGSNSERNHGNPSLSGLLADKTNIWSVMRRSQTQSVQQWENLQEKLIITSQQQTDSEMSSSAPAPQSFLERYSHTHTHTQTLTNTLTLTPHTHTHTH